MRGLTLNIPAEMITSQPLQLDRNHEIEFVNTESNSDRYSGHVSLRSGKRKIKVRVLLNTSILAYPALEMIWVFGTDQYEVASSVYNLVVDNCDEVEEDYNRTMLPAASLAATLQEANKFVAPRYLESSNIPMLDESRKEANVSDWRMSIYCGHYPTSEVEEIKKYRGNDKEKPLNRKAYPLRGGL